MNAYAIALFLHIAGALGFSVVLGLEWIGLSRIQSAARAEEARLVFGMLGNSQRLGFVSMLSIAVTGIYMLLAAWGFVPWIVVVLGALALGMALSMALSGPRMAAIGKALAAEKGPFSRSFRELVHDPVLWISIRTRTAIVLGIIFLKIAKPNLGGSLLVMGLAIVLGLASALPVSRREREQEGTAD